VIDVVKAAAKAANWDARPSPRRANGRTGTATGRGIACVAYEGDNGYAALVAEVEVNQTTGKYKRNVLSSPMIADLSRTPTECVILSESAAHFCKMRLRCGYALRRGSR